MNLLVRLLLGAAVAAASALAYKRRGTRAGRPAPAAWAVLSRAYRDWKADQPRRLAATLAYFTVFSIAPLALILTAILGLVLGPEAAQGLVFDHLRAAMGPESAKLVQGALARIDRPAASVTASLAGFAVLLFGASAAVGELQASLNHIWKVRTRRAPFWATLRDRAAAVLFILTLGALLLASLTLSAVVSAAGKYFAGFLTVPEWSLHAVNAGISLALITLLFALAFKYLPYAKVAWRDAWTGAVFTALLFTVGNVLLGLYLGKGGPASAFGAAGSLILILVWTYYSAQIVYFGAEFTHVYSQLRLQTGG
jgi:membrane protein